MRQMKFRGKDMTTGEWQYGCLVNNLWVYAPHHSLAGQPVCEIIVCDTCDDYEDMQAKDLNRTVDPKTVGMFTGQKDKNGKEIWEGDIIKIHDPEEDNGMGHKLHYQPIEFESGCFRIEWDFGEYDMTALGWAIEWFNGHEITIEIIGNVHENPELLNNL